jgi:hypothetical protein
MTTSPSYSEIVEACAMLNLDIAGKSESDVRILFWKTMYERTVDQIDHLRQAVVRLMTDEPRTPGALLQCEADATLVMNHSLSERPFDLIDYLRHNQRR